MADLHHCTQTCRRWALASWRALTPARRATLLRIASPGRVDRRESLDWARSAELVVGDASPELTPLGRLVVSVGAAELARGVAS